MIERRTVPAKLCKKSLAECDTCQERFRCWTKKYTLYFLIQRGGRKPQICYSISGRREYTDEELEVALKDCENLNKWYPDLTYAVEAAQNIEELEELGYEKG